MKKRTPNFIIITKMTNRFFDFKNYLNLLSPEEWLREINFMINEFNKSNHIGENIAKKNSHIKWTKNIKKTNNI